MTAPLDPLLCAAFLITAFSLAGVVQAVWLSSPASRRFGFPLDGGRTWRGRPILGANKTARGFVAMVPATALGFTGLAALASASPSIAGGLWPLTMAGYGWTGALAGLGFMAGELPNSFVKRRLGIAPGTPGPGAASRVLVALADRVDSPLGMLAALALVVEVPIGAVALVLLIGPLVHAGFSVMTWRLGGKARAA